MPERTLRLNPSISPETTYSPIGIRGARYSPRSLVSTVRLCWVPAWVMVTLAFGTRAPEVSSTEPLMLPVEVCAHTARHPARDKTKVLNIDTFHVPFGNCTGTFVPSQCSRVRLHRLKACATFCGSR